MRINSRQLLLETGPFCCVGLSDFACMCSACNCSTILWAAVWATFGLGLWLIQLISLLPFTRLDNSFSCSYFHGQTSWSACSMSCTLWENITPFFHSPRFFSCPTASKISPTSGIPPLSLLSLWLSTRPYMHFLVQHFYAWSSASSSCLVILVSLSASKPSVSSAGYTFRPHRIMFVLLVEHTSWGVRNYSQISFNIHEDCFKHFIGKMWPR